MLPSLASYLPSWVQFAMYHFVITCIMHYVVLQLGLSRMHAGISMLVLDPAERIACSWSGRSGTCCTERWPGGIHSIQGIILLGGMPAVEIAQHSQTKLRRRISPPLGTTVDPLADINNVTTAVKQVMMTNADG